MVVVVVVQEGAAAAKVEGGVKGGGGGMGCLLLDECHKAKNLVDKGTSSQTARAVVSLQERLPQARVVYCSATGASSVKNMAYMQRLGLWGKGSAFENFEAFGKAIEKAGFGAMELVALDMKQRGMYLSRALSYKDATFETIEVQLSPEQCRLYDRCAQFWQAMQECFESAIERVNEMDGWKAPPHAMSQFWGAHQRFFKQLLMAMKVPSVVQLAREGAEGKCVVIGLGPPARRVASSQGGGRKGSKTSGLLAIIQTFSRRNSQRVAIATRMTRRTATGARGGRGGTAGRRRRRRRRARARARQRLRSAAPYSAGAAFSAAAAAAASASSSSSSRKRPLPESDGEGSSDSDDELSIEAAMAKKAALDAAPRTFSRLSAALLHLSCAAFLPEYKVPKQRDDRIKKLVELYTGLWQLSPSQLRRKISDLGMRPEQKAALGLTGAAKKALVEAVWARTVVSHYRLLSAAGDVAGGLLVADLARGLGLDISSPILDGANSSGSGNGGGLDGDAAGGGDDQAAEDEVGASARQRVLSGSLRGIKEDLLSEADSLSLPDNPLDMLISELGGSDKVSELTGRKNKLVYEDGRAKMVARAKALDVTIAKVNLAEKAAFMKGEKMIAIISEAASSASRWADRADNRAKRVHITLELPWSADEALNSSATHRSNQTSAPEYRLLMTNIGGERRFAAQLAQRLQHLGALTKGDRRAADAADLSQFDFQTRYGRKALERLIESVRRRSLGVGRPMKLVRAVLGYDVSEEESDEKWEAHCEDVETALMTVGFDLTNPGATKGERERALNVKQFLNRLLGLATATQNRCFRHFTAMFDDEIARDKSEGGTTMESSTSRARRSSSSAHHRYTDPTPRRALRSSHHRRPRHGLAARDRGHNAAQEREDAAPPGCRRRQREVASRHINGFYEDKHSTIAEGGNGGLIIRKQYQEGEALLNRNYEMYRVLTPNFGLSWFESRISIESYKPIKHKLDTQAGRTKAERLWTSQHKDTKKCVHFQPCRRRAGECSYDSRVYTEAIIAGAILPLWNALEYLTTELNSRGTRRPMRVTRLKLSDGTRIVGIKLPYGRLRNWRATLQRVGVEMDEEAQVVIDLVEKDASAQEQRATGEKDDKRAKPEAREGAVAGAGTK